MPLAARGRQTGSFRNELTFIYLNIIYVHIHITVWGYARMKICFPVLENNGIESAVYGHFGSAPGFILVDMFSGEVTDLANEDRVHQHGACNPAAALEGHEIKAVVVGGIGGGALRKLNGAGMRVFQAKSETVGENMKLLRASALAEFMPGDTCGGHAHGHGCSH